jgi:hypothetical protein
VIPTPTAQASITSFSPPSSTEFHAAAHKRLDGHFHMDIPLILARDLTGFRHDELNPAVDDSPFDELDDLRARGGWWKFWK